jgi:hypothetical protein
MNHIVKKTNNNQLKALFIIPMFMVVLNCFSQQSDTIYYDRDWKKCNKEKAEYFRIVNYDSTGQLKDTVKDYYISGGIQAKIERVCFMHKKNDVKSIFEGRLDYFTEDGVIESSKYLSKNGTHIDSIIEYYENGLIKNKYSYDKEGNYDGLNIYYSDSGSYSFSIYNKGVLAENRTVFCDDEDNCYPIYSEYFNFGTHSSYWKTKFGSLISAKENEDGLLIRSLFSANYFRCRKYNMHLEDDFAISSKVHLLKGQTKNVFKEGKPYGLIWGYSDDENYNFFYLSTSWDYCYGNVTNGIKTQSEWSSSPHIENKKSNDISVYVTEGVAHYFLNMNVVGSQDIFNLGNGVGISVPEGKIKLQVKSIETALFYVNSEK